MYEYKNKKHSPEYTKLMKSDYWLEVRERIFARHEWKCALCGSSQNLECHHVRYSHLGHEAEYPEDLMCLCKKHHALITEYWQIADDLKAYYEEKRHEEAMRKGYY